MRRIHINKPIKLDPPVFMGLLEKNKLSDNLRSNLGMDVRVDLHLGLRNILWNDVGYHLDDHLDPQASYGR